MACLIGEPCAGGAARLGVLGFDTPFVAALPSGELQA